MAFILVTKRREDVHVCIDGDLLKAASGKDLHEARQNLRAKYRGLDHGTRLEFHEGVLTQIWLKQNPRLRYM